MAGSGLDVIEEFEGLKYLTLVKLKKVKRTSKKWLEFRDALAKGKFSFDEVEKAKEYTFLKV